MRIEHAEVNYLAWAFGLSLAFHLLVWGTWYSGQRFGWWENWHWPRWIEASPLLQRVLPPKPEQLAQKARKNEEVPLMFVNVSQAQATADAPEKPQYYSSQNSKAANVKADQDTGIPKIDGTQAQVPKTETVARKEFQPLQPARPPSAQPAPETQEEARARPKPAPGDLDFSKPETDTKPDTGQERRSRPRTLKEAMARKQDSRVPGEKMYQEGGVKRHLDIASLDAVGTPFGAYDAALVEAVSQRWFSLLDERSYASDSRGKVVLQFVLHQDGRVSEMRVADNTAGEVMGLICQKAVLDPAPFAAWPAEMRRTLGETRNIQFTFYYN